MLSYGAIALALASTSASASQDITKDRAKIVEIVRDELLNDPELLQEALNKLAVYQQDIANKKFEDKYRELENIIERSAGNILGDRASSKKIIVFSDYNCKYCAKLSEILKNRKETNYKIIVHELPILGEMSEMIAKYAIVVASLGDYEKFYFGIFSNPHKTENDLLKIISELGLDYKMISKEVQKPWVSDVLDKNRKIAEDLGISGTPTLIYERNKLENGVMDLPKILDSRNGAVN